MKNEYLRPFAGLDGKQPLSIVLSGITYPDASYYIKRTRADLCVIEYVTDGEGVVIVDGEHHRVCKDTVYLLPQGKRHEYYADSKRPFTKIFMNVQGSLCEQLLVAFGLTGKYFFDGTGLKPIFERAAAAIRSDLGEAELQALLQGVFVEILSRLSVALGETKYSEEALKMRWYLDLHAERIVPAKELSGVIFRSPDYCLKLFRREFGTTPYAYQLTRKMEMARLLLRDTAMPVGEIAERLGYTDLHYFSNLFYKKCGCRPTDYRKGKGEG